MRRHLVLVGLPGCGKSAVGHDVAEALGARLFDIDQLLVREMGMPVAQIFGMVGEPRFREIEHKAVQAAVAAEEPAVIVPGGGWAAQQGHMHWAGQSLCLRIYLRCLPQTAAKRADLGETRPLLVGNDPVGRMRKLLDLREPFYKLADFEVAAEQDTAHVVGGCWTWPVGTEDGKGQHRNDLQSVALRLPAPAPFLLFPEIDHTVTPEITLQTWRHDPSER